MKTGWTKLAAALLVCGSFGCQEQSDPKTAADVDEECGPEDDAKHAADTVGSAAKTGGTTAWEGMKTFGESVGGLFSGGADEAEKKWKEGSEETKRTAKEGAEETRSTAKKRCRERD